MFQETAIAKYENGTEMLFDERGITKWNTFTSVQDTIEILAHHEVSTFMNVLEMCRILYEAKQNWSGVGVISTEEALKNGDDRAKWVSKKEDNWDRFCKELGDNGVVMREVNQLIKIQASWLNGGLVKRMFQQTAYLPTSKTTLYEMSTLDGMLNSDVKIMDACIDRVKKNGEIATTEVRELKRNKGLEKTKASSTIEATDGTNLRMPIKKELVEKLQKKWKEVSVHLEAVNELTTGIQGFGIHYESPTDVLKAMEHRELQKEREWTIRKGMAYVNKFVIMASAAIADVKKDETDKKGNKVKSAVKFNEELVLFLANVKKHRLTGEIDKLVKDRLQDVEHMKTKGLKANTNFTKAQSTTTKANIETLTLNKSSNSSPSIASSNTAGERKWGAV